MLLRVVSKHTDVLVTFIGNSQGQTAKVAPIPR